jgi:hypothetical protein
MATCPSNAVVSSQDVATGNLTCFDINGTIIGSLLTGNQPLSIGGTNKCPLQTAKIRTNLTTNSYQCETIVGGILSNSNPCPAGWVPNYYNLSQNGTLEYGCNNTTGSSTPFSCAYGITPTQNRGLTPMTGCIIPARPSIPTPTPSSSNTSSSNTSTSNSSDTTSNSSDTSSSNTSSSDVSSSDLTSADAPQPEISLSNSTSSSNISSSNSTSSNSPSSSTPSTNNIGFYIIIIGILITIIVIGVISYFVFFNNHSNKSIDITNKGGYYYFK